MALIGEGHGNVLLLDNAPAVEIRRTLRAASGWMTELHPSS